MKRLGKITLILAVILTVLAWWLVDRPEQDEEAKTRKRELILPVQIGHVAYLDVVDEIRTVGNLQAEQRVIITSEVEGRVKRIPVHEGTRVTGGEILAKIDPREYRIEVERLRAELVGAQKDYEKTLKGLRPEDKEKLQAQVKADESSLGLALKELKRAQQLVAEGVVSESILDEANDRVQRAKETLRSSKAALSAGSQSRPEDIIQAQSRYDSVKKRLDLAKLNLSKTKVRAPFDGVIISKKIEVGAFAKEGTPLIEMIGSSKLKAVLEIPQSYRGKLNKLTEIEFHVQDLGLKFTLNRKIKNKVRVIPDANIFSGNIKVQIDLPKPNPALFPGLTLEALLRFDSRKKVPHVPSIALSITENGTVVYIVKEQKAHLVPVKAFKERNDFVEIEDFTHQLGPKADLVLRGSGAVFPGVKVLITNPEPKAKAPFNAADKGKMKSKGEKPET